MADISYPAIAVLSLAAPAAWVALAAYLYLLALSVALTVIDVGTHRLPNVLVLPSYLVASRCSRWRARSVPTGSICPAAWSG